MRIPLTLLVVLIGCSTAPVVEVPAGPVEAPQPDLFRRAREAMGTLVEITVHGVDAAVAAPAVEAAFAEIARVEAVTSEWRPESELTRVNEAAGGAALAVSPELFGLVQRAMSIAAETEGAFDPTFAALWGLWTFGDDGVRKKPDDAEVTRRLGLVDYRKVRLDPPVRTVQLPEPGMRLGLGGIAKGYAVERAAAVLKDRGIGDFLVKAGGEIRTSGRRGEAAWTVGLRHPRAEGLLGVVTLGDDALSTSGDYERWFEEDGVRYHHIIDPRTGYPARASQSATVLAADATLADALSTALFVLGPPRLMEIADRHGVDALVVDAAGEVHTTPGMRARVRLR